MHIDIMHKSATESQFALRRMKGVVLTCRSHESTGEFRQSTICVAHGLYASVKSA